MTTLLLPVDYLPAEADTWEEAFEKYAVPVDLRGGLLRYFMRGLRAGSFLDACLCNNFKLAVSLASSEMSLRPIALLLMNEAPGCAWGSPERVDDFLARHSPLRKRDGGAT